MDRGQPNKGHHRNFNNMKFEIITAGYETCEITVAHKCHGTN